MGNSVFTREVQARASGLQSAVEVARRVLGYCPVSPAEEWLTLAEIRRRLKLHFGRTPHATTIYTAITNGLPTVKHPYILGRRLYPWAEVLEWMRTRMSRDSKNLKRRGKPAGESKRIKTAV